ncbi:hypothetical protein NE473_31240, partial [Hungatella sp. SL.1.14]|nr:hypothetical protein [Hungatella sp. SL.1.14]
GGAAGPSTSMGVYIYSTFYTDLDYGKATAASCILFLVIADRNIHKRIMTGKYYVIRSHHTSVRHNFMPLHLPIGKCEI